MYDLEAVRELTMRYQTLLKNILRIQETASRDYIDKLIDLGLTVDEASELYLETTANTGKWFFNTQEDGLDMDLAMKFLKMIED